ncbi:WD repeat and HMG-box DNA-binding protein 1-like [Coffea eugenioides]|uniref:WD repeat and HMG-box DNA-binding protein 1-like n=1 Tax=Coffea eugenioides TaxID=49369 RepID=UPI000F6124E7|nr:WD repeat and HMG-box DNA-binding protein 1-like [Coffea eugenioides]
MKIRTIKLREAHKNGENGGNSFCSILWDQQGDRIVTASSSDPSIWVHDAQFPSVNPKSIKHHRDGVTALALSPNFTCLASGSIDHSVKLYKFPGGEFVTNITRFTLPIRALAFNKSGTMLAAAGDDEGIKLINTIDGSIARVLKGHKGSITGLAFDPKSEYFASVDSTGTVIHWELQPGTILNTLKGIAPATFSDQSAMNMLSWSPDGDLLAVPGLKNDVVMYDRDTAEKLFSLRGDHVQPICFLSWSPNGRYMATSGSDRQIIIWDVDKKQDIDRQKFSDRISCMAWKPHGNALAVIDSKGKYGVWESPVPSSMKSPTEDIPNVRSNGLLLFDEDEEEASASGSLSDLGEDSLGESELSSRKRLRKNSTLDDSWGEDMNDELDLHPKVESHKKASKSKKDSIDHEKHEIKNSMTYSAPKMQEAFQPGATPVQPGKRRFLCYNMLGSVTSMDHDGYSHIEIDFHDTSSGPRVPAMTDYFGFTMASLNENGSVFANPCKGEKNMSTLMYRPFSSWASNSEWSMRLEEEEVRAVALGTTWVAAATSLNFLRIFSDSGLQRYILSLDGPVVTLVGLKDELAVVTHSSPALPSDGQMLEFRVLNVRSATESLRGRLPLTPGSYLTWFGFSEEGQLGSFDSKGVLRVYTNQYGGSWFPVFSSSKLKKPDENYWVVGLNATKLFCVVCKSPYSFPQATPKPILTLLDLSFPLAASDLGAENLENEFILNNMHLHQIQKRIEENAAAGRDTASIDDEAFTIEAALDRCILRLIASCCNGDKLVRATELVKLLSMEKSVKGAIKLVTALKLPNLAERFSTILEERMSNEAMGSTVLHGNFKFDAPVQADDVFQRPSLPESSTEKAVLPFPPQRSSTPSFPKEEKTEQPPNAGNGIVEPTRALRVGKTVEAKNAGEAKDVKEATNPVKKQPEEIPVSFNRPSNPFAKKSNRQEHSSLFDSIKKMKTDATGKR